MINRCYLCGRELKSTADVNGLCAECNTKEFNEVPECPFADFKKVPNKIEPLTWRNQKIKNWDGEKMIDTDISQPPSNIEIAKKINEIIDYINNN